jgi:NDP-sugar pyrophosphorylase family protein
VKGIYPGVVVVNSHHLAEKLERHIHERDFGVRVEISHEPELLGTAGGIKAAEKWLAGEDFVVVNSDVITEVDWDSMLAFHKQRGALATLALREDPKAADYGALCVDGTGRITRFLDSRNPGYQENQKPMMFAGVSILSPRILDMIPAGGAVDISAELYRPLTEQSGPLYGFVASGSWADAGSVALYHKAVMDRLDMNPEMVYTGGKEYKHVWFRPPVYVDPGAHIRAGCILGPRVAIHADSVLGTCVYMKNCVVLPKRHVRSGGALEGMVI